MSVEKRVEGVKEFFLRAFFAAEKLNVVDEKKIGLAITLAEFHQIAVLDRVDELVDEKFAREIDHLGGFLFRPNVLADGLHQMRLAQSYPAVNKQRVISPGRRLRHRQTGRMRDLVVRTDHKRFERVSGIEPERAAGRFRVTHQLRRHLLQSGCVLRSNVR